MDAPRPVSFAEHGALILLCRESPVRAEDGSRNRKTSAPTLAVHHEPEIHSTVVRRARLQSHRPPGGRRPGRTVRGVPDFLTGGTAWDEERADEESYEDTPALQAFAEEVDGDDLAAFLAGMGTGESRELRCENGAFEIVRDR